MPTPTAAQLRAARALLQLTQGDVAKAAGISLPTMKRLEHEQHFALTSTRTRGKAQAALEDAGAVFSPDGKGVRLR